MCNPASFVLTRGHRAHWSKDSDSHEAIIREMGVLEWSATVRYVRCEIVPPGGDYRLPLAQWEYRLDQEDVPDWYDAVAAAAACRAALPQWAAHHILRNGGTCRDGQSRIVLGGVCEYTGGYCYGYAGCTIHATGQQGGDCLGFDGCTIYATDQRGGYCYGFDGCTIHATGQQGGDCLGRMGCTIYATDQRGGYCYGYAGCAIHATGQQGGDCYGDDGCTINVTGKRGGYCYGYDGCTLNGAKLERTTYHD